MKRWLLLTGVLAAAVLWMASPAQADDRHGHRDGHRPSRSGFSFSLRFGSGGFLSFGPWGYGSAYYYRPYSGYSYYGGTVPYWPRTYYPYRAPVVIAPSYAYPSYQYYYSPPTYYSYSPPAYYYYPSYRPYGW